MARQIPLGSIVKFAGVHFNTGSSTSLKKDSRMVTFGGAQMRTEQEVKDCQTLVSRFKLFG
jgi:hypothetical protein